MRTYAEIKARIDQLETDRGDYFGWKRVALIELLPFHEAGEFLKPEATVEDWEHYQDAEDAIRSYLDFAVEKAVRQRGLSANRSTDRIEAWLWAHGDPDLLRRYLEAGFEPYGAPQLEVVARQWRPDLLDDLAKVTNDGG